jgi:hypothetical protein
MRKYFGTYFKILRYLLPQYYLNNPTQKSHSLLRKITYHWIRMKDTVETSRRE